MLVIFFTLFNCSSPTNSNNNANGHTINRSGVYHKSGLKDPLNNCVECHGGDLMGGSAGVSCYSCHGQKW